MLITINNLVDGVIQWVLRTAGNLTERGYELSHDRDIHLRDGTCFFKHVP